MSNLRKYADFSGQNIYTGIDTHKKSFMVSIHGEKLKYKTFSQPPDPKKLVNYLQAHFPGGNYYAAYEASFSGFWIQESLQAQGVNCIVVNPCDIPTTDKEKKQKRDRLDSNRLAKYLKQDLLKGIHLPTKEEQQDRSLVRSRYQLASNQRRCKNRIKSLLDFYGVKLALQFSEPGTHWSKNFMSWLTNINLGSISGNTSLGLLIEEASYLRSLILKANRAIKLLSGTAKYEQTVKLLLSVPGIGLLTAMVFLTEIGDIRRFRRIDELCSYIGLIPNVYASGEKEKVGDMTHRGNSRLKAAIIESSWVAVRHDPALGSKYHQFCQKMKANKAIIKIARKLLNRIRKVLLSKQPYQLNISV